MPTETNRAIKRKHIQLPQGGSVDIPVITQITFLDVVDQGQESEFHLENGAQGKRDVRVASVPGNGAATDETGVADGLKVERVDVWRVLDVVEHGQETFFHPDSKTVKQPPDAPPYFVTHEKTRVVKYINTPDDGNWIKSELIDKWKFGDVVDQGQETEYFLFNPPDNAGIKGLTLGTDSDGTPTIAVDPGLDAIGDAVDPVRTDPFQNIVDFASSGTAHFKVWVYGYVRGVIGGGFSGSASLSPADGEVVDNFAYSFDDATPGPLVSGTVTGMGGAQTVPIGSFLVSQTFSGTAVTGIFKDSTTNASTTLTWDFSGMSFAPTHPPSPGFAGPFTSPHKIVSGGAGTLCNLLLTGK
jgi:hypothetical protein